MSCWVVPAIAAEFWRIPLEQVMDKLRRHAVPTRVEDGFTFIDILPDPGPAAPLPREQRPMTYEVAPAGLEAVVRGEQGVTGRDWVSSNAARLQTAALRRGPG